MILDRLSIETGVPKEHLAKIVKTASHRYKTYKVPKKAGGERTINQPTPQVKYLQRWIVRNIIDILPLHPAVTSYRKNVGIAANALKHAEYNYLLRVDLKDFFPSITGDDLRQLLTRNSKLLSGVGVNDDDFDVIVSLACRADKLTIGAPSSPAISNSILYEFDCKVYEHCKQNEVEYSRYADDLCFSTDVPNKLSQILQFIRGELQAQSSPALHINEEKTVFTSRKRRKVVTGVIITSIGTLSVGRLKKRILRTMVFKFGKGELDTTELAYLKGYLCYVRAVEPGFIVRLRNKYGNEMLDKILSS